MPPFFSLITGTVGRVTELTELLHSLAGQTCLSFELILIDQSASGISEDLWNTLPFPVIHKRARPGLSRARNLGLQLARGEVVAFPDDDCTYPQALLQELRDYFERDPEIDGCSTLVTDQAGNYSAGGYMAGRAQRITRGNVWRTAVSPSLFLRRSAIAGFFFDEELGVGTTGRWGSGEETDFVLQLLARNRQLRYEPRLVVWHPVFRGPWMAKRGWRYGCGCGAVLRKHHYPVSTALRMALLQLIRAGQAGITLRLRKSRFHLLMASGRLYGFFTDRG